MTATDRPIIVADPGVQFGEPCIGGTRVPAAVLANDVAAGDSVEVVADGYDVSRADVLWACVWTTTGYPGAALRGGGGPRHSRAWRRWAEDAFGPLAGHNNWGVACLDDVPDPPKVKS